MHHIRAVTLHLRVFAFLFQKYSVRALTTTTILPNSYQVLVRVDCTCLLSSKVSESCFPSPIWSCSPHLWRIKLVLSPALHIDWFFTLFKRRFTWVVSHVSTICTMSRPKLIAYGELPETRQASKAYIFTPGMKLHWVKRLCAGCSQALMRRDRGVISPVIIPATFGIFL